MPALAHAITGSSLPSSIPALPQTHSLTRARVSKISERLPLYFEANHGQADEPVKFVSRGRGYTLLLTPSEAVMVLQNPQEKSRRARTGIMDRNDADLNPQVPQHQTTVRMKLVGATAEPKVVGIDELRGKSNYFIGNDPKKWRRNVPQYAKVRYEEVYPGIDLVFYGNESRLEFDFIVAPGADPDLIRLAFEGADKIETDKEGHLTLESSGGLVRLKKPFIYQDLDGVRQEISGGYALNRSGTENPSPHVVAFELASYDPTKLLVIDPGLEYSTFLGWSGLEDSHGIALDTAGNFYVVGSTGLGYGVIDVFVAKFSGDDYSLLYATFFGGSTNGKIGVAGDWGQGIAVDADGNAYVTGRAEASDFPTTDGTSANGYADAFVAKLSSDGSTLLYSTRFGGSGFSEAYAIALDTQGSAYVTGSTSSVDFPTTPGAFDAIHDGSGHLEAFVAKLSADGSQLLYATFLGGSRGSDIGVTEAFAIAVDGAGNAHVTGSTGWFDAPLFPITPGAFDTSYNGGQDAFVAKLSTDGSQLLYATYLGGNAQDVGLGIALDAAGNAYVTGRAESLDFPTTPGAFETTFGTDLEGNAFVAKLSADGSTLLYSTYLGGSSGDAAKGIAVDAAGNTYVVGSTCSGDFPTTAGAISESQISPCGIVDLGPNGDAFVAKLSADGSRLLYATYLGGSNHDEGSGGIAVDPDGNVYVAGRTRSSNFPTTAGAFEPGGGPWDAFVAKLSMADTNVNPGTLGLDAIGYFVREDVGAAVITVIRRNGRDGQVSVDFATSDSHFTPATAGVDYIATSGTLVFADGETSKSFTVPILDDQVVEGDERVVLTLSNVQGGATLGVRNLVWLTINDEDPIFLPTLTVAKTGSGSGTVVSNIRRDINCGSVCSKSYPSGTSVTLTASPASGSTFAGWSGGGCAGTGSCTLTINADTSVTATFNPSNAITVTSPNGGENWRRRTKHTIRWTHLGNLGTSVKIDLLKAGVLNRTIRSSASIRPSGSGSVTWTVPGRQTPGSDYNIRICSISSPSICDTSDGNFTIR